MNLIATVFVFAVVIYFQVSWQHLNTFQFACFYCTEGLDWIWTKYQLYWLALFVTSPGLQGGPAHQVSTLPWTVQHLPHQAVLHLQYSHHPAVCPGLQSLRHFSDAFNTFQWQLPRQSPGNLVCKYIMCSSPPAHPVSDFATCLKTRRLYKECFHCHKEATVRF